MLTCTRCGGTYPVAHGYCPLDGTPLATAAAPAHDGAVDTKLALGAIEIGQVLDRRYRLDEIIGGGGMGVVVRATHTLIGKTVAIKILRPEHVHDEEVVRRFLLEARIASSIKHPSVVDMSDYGELPGAGAFYVMEYLKGDTLADRIDQHGPLGPRDAVEVALQICLGLAAAHDHGVIHRDLKPENVFLCTTDYTGEFRVKLLDFGIARVESAERSAATGKLVGTPEYMSPEQAKGLSVDARSDLYALGVILFEMLTGLVPFRSDDVSITLESHICAPPPALGDVDPKLGALHHISKFAETLLSKAPDGRPASADAAARDLRAAMRADLGAQSADASASDTASIGPVPRVPSGSGSSKPATPRAGPEHGPVGAFVERESVRPRTRRRLFATTVATTALVASALILGAYALLIVDSDETSDAMPASAVTAQESVAGMPDARHPHVGEGEGARSAEESRSVRTGAALRAAPPTTLLTTVPILGLGPRGGAQRPSVEGTSRSTRSKGPGSAPRAQRRRRRKLLTPKKPAQRSSAAPAKNGIKDPFFRD